MKRIPIAALLAILVGALMVPQAGAQTASDAFRFSQRSPITGARIMGMGGAGIAGVADQSAFFINPASLGLYQHSELSGALNTFSTVDEASGFSESLDSDIRDTGLLNIGYVYRVPTVRGSLVVGAAFSRVNSFDRNFAFRGMNERNSITNVFVPFQSDFSVEEDELGYYPDFANTTQGNLSELAYLGGAIEFLPENVEGGGNLWDTAVFPGDPVQQRGEILEEGRMNEASLGGAVEAAPGVMIGASVNLAFGSYRFQNEYREVDVEDADAGNPYIVRPSEGVEYVGFDELVHESWFESDLVGVNARIGLTSEVASGVRAGLTLETPTYYTVSEDYGESITTFFEDGEMLSYGGEPGDFTNGAFEYEVVTPWRFGGGLGYDAGPVTLSVDAEFVDWTQMELQGSETFDAENAFIRDEYDAVVNTRLGAEYRLGSLALRGGFAYMPDPRGYDAVDRARTFFGAGAGYRLAEQVSVDFGWSQERFDSQYIPYNAGDLEEPPVIDEEVVRNRFAVGVRFGF